MQTLITKTPTFLSLKGQIIEVNGMDFDAMCNMMAWHLSKNKSPVAVMLNILFFGGSVPAEDEFNLSYRKAMPTDWTYEQQFLVNKAKIKEFIDSQYISLTDFHKVITSNVALHEILNNNHFVFVTPPSRR